MEIINFLDGRFKYDDDGQFIWLVDSEGKLQKIADLRGWGAIQNLFKGDKGIIDSDKASKFQDAIGEWIVNALNSKLEEEKKDHKNYFVISEREIKERIKKELDYRREIFYTNEASFDIGFRLGIKWIKEILILKKQIMENEEAKKVIKQLKEINLQEAIEEFGADWMDDIIENISDRFLAGLLTGKINELNQVSDDELIRDELIEVCENYLEN